MRRSFHLLYLLPKTLQRIPLNKTEIIKGNQQWQKIFNPLTIGVH